VACPEVSVEVVDWDSQVAVLDIVDSFLNRGEIVFDREGVWPENPPFVENLLRRQGRLPILDDGADEAVKVGKIVHGLGIHRRLHRRNNTSAGNVREQVPTVELTKSILPNPIPIDTPNAAGL
jgi:hypothetical protein